MAAPGAESTSPDPKELVTQAALRHGLPPDLVHSVAQVESGHRQDVVSPKGAIGLMQLMPQTARELQVDPSNPEQNADAGARYLRELLLRYLNDPYQLRKALAAYNAGPAAVDRYKGIPPYPETINYIRKVLEVRNKYAR
jgi:soluble lytic murein transglycosylase-like protein